MTRIAHYVVSTHWDREWYEPFQGYRMRLVSLLDEVFDFMEREPAFKTFTMDGQIIPVLDYLEIRPEREKQIRQFVEQGRFKLGPWYVLPDEWLISGESFVRNIQTGMQLSSSFGAPTSRAGFIGDEFGHISQMPQILSQFGLPVAFLWRGTNEETHKGHFNWRSPDGSVVPTYRFGRNAYCTYGFEVRRVHKAEEVLTLEQLVENLVCYTKLEAGRSEVGPIFLFDGADHMEIEPKTVQMIARANEALAKENIRIIHSDLDAYMAELLKEKGKIHKQFSGELRETGKPAGNIDEVWAIPGILGSRMYLKQKNALCEDELCLWAEPFAAFASELGGDYPAGYLRVAWRHLLDNHPHDSIGGCSIDQVHRDMEYRFDQSLGIAERLTKQAQKAIALAAAPKERAEGSEGGMLLAVFNATAEALEEAVDLEIPLPRNWKTFAEWERTEEKFSFRLRGADGQEIPYQLVGQKRDRVGFRRVRGKFPQDEMRHVVSVTAMLKVPAFGYTTILVEPAPPPTRFLGNMASTHRTIENEFLKLRVNANGTLNLIDKRSGRVFDQLLTFEEQSDIGDGWAHNVPVNEQIFTSSAGNAEVALVANGIARATLRITVTMNVPAQFDFRAWTRSERTVPLKIVSDVTLRKGADRVEVMTTVENNVLDHRVRVLFPTDLQSDTYLADSVFDVVERSVPLPADNERRRELEVETRPQLTWTAFDDGKLGLAVVSRGLTEIAVRDTADRAIALTLFRGFSRTIFAEPSVDAQMQGKQVFRYAVVPFAGAVPVKKLSLLGQRVNGPVRTVDLLAAEMSAAAEPGSLPREKSFLTVDGNAVVTSVQKVDGKLQVRLFNPFNATERVRIEMPSETLSPRSITLEGVEDKSVSMRSTRAGMELSIPAKRIATIVLE